MMHHFLQNQTNDKSNSWSTNQNLRLNGILSVLFIVWNASVTSAQFQLDIEQLAANSYAVEEVAVGETPQQLGRPFAMQQDIDGWIFNRHGNAANAKRHFENQLKARVESLDKEFQLSADQKHRLRIAGSGDMAGFFSEVEVIRKEFEGQQDRNKINQVIQRIQPLQLKMRKGIFSHDSLLAKVSRRTLNADQLKQYQAMERARIKFGYLASIKIAISELEKSSPLKSDQRKQIVGLLEKSEPPRALGQYLHYYVLYRLAKEKKKVNKILAPGQQKAMRQAPNRGLGMQQFLKQKGFIE